MRQQEQRRASWKTLRRYAGQRYSARLDQRALRRTKFARRRQRALRRAGRR